MREPPPIKYHLIYNYRLYFFSWMETPQVREKSSAFGSTWQEILLCELNTRKIGECKGICCIVGVCFRNEKQINLGAE